MQGLCFNTGNISLLADKNLSSCTDSSTGPSRVYPSLWGYVFPFDSIKGCNEMQMDGSLNQPICSIHDSRHHSAYQHAVTNLQMSTTNPPHVSLLLSVVVPLPLRDKCQCVGMYRCWSVIVRGEAWSHGNKSASSIPPPLGTWLFVQGSGPFCHATGDPRPLNPSSTRSQLNPNSYILMSRVQSHPPPDTLLDKDTCDSTLCRPFFQSSLLEVGLLQVISAQSAQIKSLLP